MAVICLQVLAGVACFAGLDISPERVNKCGSKMDNKRQSPNNRATLSSPPIGDSPPCTEQCRVPVLMPPINLVDELQTMCATARDEGLATAQRGCPGPGLKGDVPISLQGQGTPCIRAREALDVESARLPAPLPLGPRVSDTLQSTSGVSFPRLLAHWTVLVTKVFPFLAQPTLPGASS